MLLLLRSKFKEKMKMTEEKTKKVEVEMTLEEASELFDKAFRWQEDRYNGGIWQNKLNPAHWTNFFRTYEFSPQTLSTLADYLTRPDILENGKSFSNENRYSSGDLFIARKKKGKIEFVEVVEIEEDFWKGGKSRKFRTNGLFGSKLAYFIYTNKDFLDLDKLAENHSGTWRDIKKFELPENGAVTLQDASNLPIWENKADYEKFIRAVYGDKSIDERLKQGHLFYLIDSHDKIGKKWDLVTTGISNWYCLDANQLFQSLDGSGQSILRGTIQIPPYPKNNLEGHLIRNYVQPQNIGNGVVVMNEDRIPKYLKRMLGL